MEKELVKINALERPRYELENMKLNSSILIPSFQKASVSTTIGRIKDTSAKRYSVRKVNDYSYTVKRIR